jgi:hypothetical protein
VPPTVTSTLPDGWVTTSRPPSETCEIARCRAGTSVALTPVGRAAPIAPRSTLSVSARFCSSVMRPLSAASPMLPRLQSSSWLRNRCCASAPACEANPFAALSDI